MAGSRRPTQPRRSSRSTASGSGSLGQGEVRTPKGAATVVARRVLDGDRRATAVFCFSGSLAYGVYAAAEASLVVGREVSGVGFDDHPVSRVLTPPLTTVGWGPAQIAVEAARLTASATEGKRARRKRILCAPVMCARGSAVAV
ncbi:substrate-binding domain-containing protein [Streptomyces sp. NPDC002580]|uniref:substrate-binding domain-containing protein n=1 Tax=Streptomyces sp. NPDC002580 TaxID=3364653 RepID=UPI0036B3FEF8